MSAEHPAAQCCDKVYFCPTSGDTECPVHGGFDVCCDRPDLHRPVASAACLCEWRGDLRAGTHAACPTHTTFAARYATIVADPPWRYGNQRGAAARGHARNHYDTMTIPEIAALPISDLAEPDAHLWLWGVNQLLDEVYGVARAWGFEPLTLLTWCKTQPGVGYYLRNNTEHCLFATRGKPQVPAEQAMASWFIWPRSEHSRKPEAFLDLVEQVSPGPYLEMFSRRTRLGWDTWGNEALGHVELIA